MDDVFHRRLPMIAEQGAWDPNRDKGAMPEGTPIKAAVEPLAFLAGRVEVKYGGQPAQATVADLSKCIDQEKKTVRSVTGEITTDLRRDCTGSMRRRSKPWPDSWARPARSGWPT